MSRRVPNSCLTNMLVAFVLFAVVSADFNAIAATPETPSLQASPRSAQVMWCWSGAITTNSFRVNARLVIDGAVSRLAVSPQSDLSNPYYSAFDTALAATNNRVVSHLITGLSPDTHYYYGFEINGVVDSGAIGHARTFTEGSESFTLGFASCATTGSQHAVFQTILSLHPDFFLHTGDFHYEDISVNDVSRFRSAYDRVLASPAQSALFREVPIMYMWDDHDFGPNNSDSTAPGRLAARLTYQEYLPHYPLAFGSGNISVNYTFNVGRVFFIVCDSRSARSPAYSPDNADKTMLGVAQKAWFKQQLLLANGKYPLIVWVNTLPWIGTTGDDGWYLYPTERREIANFIKANDIRGLCQLSGDAHMLAIDNGTNSDYATGGGAGFPVMQAAALDRSPSLKGGPYSEGAYPGTGQFGLMSVVDNGDSIITVNWRGLNHNLTEIVHYSFTVPVRQFVCGDADDNGSVEIFDAIYLISYIFSGGPAPSPFLLGDANCSNTVNISDAVHLIAYIFSGGFPPCPGC
jgi:phosphodiesterase/alkaline phosphatase D-like protein